jgi:hypothetical protein
VPAQSLPQHAVVGRDDDHASTWQSLPIEIKQKILSPLSSRDLSAFGHTGKESRNLSQSPAVIARQSPAEGMHSLRRLAHAGNDEAVAKIVNYNGSSRLA